MGLANSYSRSRVTSVGPSSVAERWREDTISPVGCGDDEEAGWNPQVVIKLLNNGISDDATA